jgi:hypothetical protein
MRRVTWNQVWTGRNTGTDAGLNTYSKSAEGFVNGSHEDV